LALGAGLRIAQSRYSNGVLAVMHSAQYLWITSYYARREAGTGAQGRWRPFAYFALLIAGGIALFVPGPWLASRVFHYDFTASFLLFTALVNIHHFLLDGAIWKLRDGRIAALLLNSREQLAGATAQAGTGLAAGMRWFRGESWGPRGLRVSAALLLLAWGTLDQVHYYFSLHGESLAALERAAALDAFDSSLQTRLGRKALAAGQVQQAVAAWRQAVRTSPADPGPRDLLLKYLTDHQRFDEAFGLTAQALRYNPKDVRLLLNHGILAQQLGQSGEALASWQKALALDRKPSTAHLYLAGELEREGKPGEAIPHYLTFLEQMAKAGEQNRPPAEKVIAVALALAQCQEKVNQAQAAERSYELAGKIAAQSGQVKLESLASVRQAQMASRHHQLSSALRLYQHALALDGALNDPHGEAADWYVYALFLRDSGFPARLAYACLLKSAALSRSLTNGSEPESMTQVREQVEQELGARARDLQRDPQPALEQALRLTTPP
jgi:tetratricopeptide (TPR) repeat protein